MNVVISSLSSVSKGAGYITKYVLQDKDFIHAQFMEREAFQTVLFFMMS